jgi:hypothetical protein
MASPIVEQKQTIFWWWGGGGANTTGNKNTFYREMQSQTLLDSIIIHNILHLYPFLKVKLSASGANDLQNSRLLSSLIPEPKAGERFHYSMGRKTSIMNLGRDP